MEKNSQYLSVDEFAKRLDVTPQYIRVLIKAGNIPAMMVGKSWIIDKSVLTNKELIFKYAKDVPDQIRKTSKTYKIKALSFFSGAMGLDIGLEKAGIHFLMASEIEPTTRKTILLNRPEIGLIGDINNYSASDIRKYAGLDENDDIDLIVGGPPCQAFSTAGKRLGFEDLRGNVFLTYIDHILSLRPKYAVIENVRGLLSATYENGSLKGSALIHIIKTLEKGGYAVSFNLYNAANYGAPQKRERVVIFCSRDGNKVPYITPTHSENPIWGLKPWKTLREAITGLDDSKSEYLAFPEKRLKFYRMLKSGQYWKDLPQSVQREAMGSKLEMGGGKTGFYRRLDWDKPSPTLVTDPTMPATDLCHPDKDRPLSIQEYMRIQEFPDDWILFGSIKDKYRQIGNAVPVSLGYAIGCQMKKMLEGKTLQRAPQQFPFSRYTNTNDILFVEDYNKRASKKHRTNKTT